MTEHCDDINLAGIMLVMVNGNVTHLKRRDTTRLMLEFALKGIQVLKREKASIGSDFDKLAAQYFDLASRFCLNAKNERLIEEMNTVLDLDIVKLVDKLNPFSIALQH